MNVTLFILAFLSFAIGCIALVFSIMNKTKKDWLSVVALISLVLCFAIGLTFKNGGLGQPIPIEKLADTGKFYRAVTEIDTLTSWHPTNSLGWIDTTKYEYLCLVTIQERGKYLTDYKTFDFVNVVFNPKEVLTLKDKKVPCDTHFLIENYSGLYPEKYCFTPLNDVPKR